MLQNNGSLWLHVYFRPAGSALDPSDEAYDANGTFSRVHSEPHVPTAHDPLLPHGLGFASHYLCIRPCPCRIQVAEALVPQVARLDRQKRAGPKLHRAGAQAQHASINYHSQASAMALAQCSHISWQQQAFGSQCSQVAPAMALAQCLNLS